MNKRVRPTISIIVSPISHLDICLTTVADMRDSCITGGFNEREIHMSMPNWLSRVIACCTLAVLGSHVSAQGPLPPTAATPLIPLYMAHAPQSTDHFYTTSYESYIWARNNGFTEDGGIVAYLERPPVQGSTTWSPAPGTAAFKRFYSAARTSHFYGWTAEEEAYVLANGWVAEGIEGYIYTVQVPGSAPMYRLNRTNHATGDHDHVWTLSSYEVQVYQASGWQLDGVVGYAYATPIPQIPGGAVMGNRPWLSNNGSNFDRGDIFGVFGIPSTPKTNKKATRLVFKARMTAHGIRQSGEHIAIMLRSSWSDQGWLQNGYYYWGAGLALGRLDTDCPNAGLGTSSMALELFDAGTPSFDGYPINRVFGQYFPPSTCSAAFAEGVPQEITISVTDGAQLSYDWKYFVYQMGQGTRYIGDHPGWSPYGGYKLGSTGVLITPSTGGVQPYTVYFENIQVYWD